MQNASTFKVYNASAGSGKTFTLVKEYLKILLESSDDKRFQNILAITFTNKAATEMKERVINNLRDFSDSAILNNKSEMFLLLENELNISENLLHERSKKVLKSILYNYAAFNITTIDSFTYRLIRSFAFDLGLSLNFDVEMDAKSLLNEAVDQLIAKVGEDKEVTQLLIDFSLQKVNDEKSWDISRELRDIAQLLLNENDALHVSELSDKSLEDFIKLKKELSSQLKSIESKFLEIGKQGLKLINDFEIDYRDFYYSQFPKHFQNCISDSSKLNFDISKGLSKSIENKQFYTKNKPDEVKLAIDSIINPLIELYYQSEKLHKQYSLFQLFNKNLVPLAVLSKINESLNEIKEDRNLRLNAEFNQIISTHLREQPAAFIYERLGERFKHYFIDEMQDTSKLQWSNLIPLIANALSQENASLLLVGDAKQSIYRWRGGEAEQFINLSNSENPFFIDKKKQFLETNYRSFSEIINFNNNFFQFISKYFSVENYQNIYFNENKQKTTTKQGGFVNISFLEEGLFKEDKDKLYPKRVLEIIHNLKGDFNLDEICVITRKRDQGVVIANYLNENGIDIISSETLLLQNSKEIQFIINLLTFLEFQSNKEAKLEVLFFLYDHLQINTDQHTFFTDFIDLDYSEFFNGLNDKGANFKYREYLQLPFYEGVEAIVRGFNLVASSDAYVQFFLDEVLQFSIKKQDGLQGFLLYWEENKDKLSIIAPEEKNAVRIMTIHKSKGLEFPVVIFPYDLDIYKEVFPQTWYPLTDDFNFKSLLVDNTKRLAQTGIIGEELYLKQQSKLELDNINLLYVTLTRAIEQLYILFDKKKSLDSPKWYSQFFMEYLKTTGSFEESKNNYEFGAKKRTSKRTEKTKTSINLENFVSTSWKEHNINIVTNSSLMWDSEKGEAVLYGNLIHEILSKINTQLDIDDTIESYIVDGTITQKEARGIEEIVTKIVDHSMLKKYFTNDFLIYNEREIVTSLKEIVKPDRFVVNNKKETVIIDYKTGKPEKKYVQQLALYKDALEEIGLTVVKKLLVYISDTILVEEVS